MILIHKLKHLRDLGYTPTLIFDIGAYKGEWTDCCLKVFPEAKYHLFEPNEYPEIEPFKALDNISVYHDIVFQSDKLVPWFKENTTGDSIFQECTKHYVDTVPEFRNAYSMHTLLQQYHISYTNQNILVKLDTQGSEIYIISGFPVDFLNSVDFILMELPFFGQFNKNSPTFLETIQFMDSIGFIPFDIFEEHFIGAFNMQIDIMFIHKRHPFNKIVQEQLLY